MRMNFDKHSTAILTAGNIPTEMIHVGIVNTKNRFRLTRFVKYADVKRHGSYPNASSKIKFISSLTYRSVIAIFYVFKRIYIFLKIRKNILKKLLSRSQTLQETICKNASYVFFSAMLVTFISRLTNQRTNI